MATRKIALEEAFSAPSLDRFLEITLEACDAPTKAKLTTALQDLDQRIDVMDQAGIDIFVLSETSPGVQAERETARAVEDARSANDYLQSQIERHPERYRGFAVLPTQDATAAADELERCVNDLGFVGAMINGHQNGIYLDDQRYLPFWERAAKLGVPIYIHPTDPREQPFVMRDHPEMQGAVWGWNVETSCHFLRLVFSGLFDRYPDLTVMLGHMGETLPFYCWRIDIRYAGTADYRAQKIKLKPSQYFKRNLAVTTTGVCQDSALVCAISELGPDRVLWSVDYPYENCKTAADWIEAAPIDAATRELVCYKNAERFLRI
jgi:2,3-dihydroxybenzoate decarboxylase